ncbi:MAG: HAMP domain-containing histidine kinase [Clostridiales bacterium]|nr:HAMP domain-containing histidine kinase [Clostridiales bacterium]
MIKELKRRFIVLAMASLTVLLAVIVAGMNIINYEKVVSDADSRIEVLEENAGRLMVPGGFDDQFEDFDEPDDDDDDDVFDRDDDDPLFGPGGPGGPSMSRDEAEESRFFVVSIADDGTVRSVNTDRIYSIDESEAKAYADKALASGKDEGFIDEFRYSVDEEGGVTRVMFLDCGRTLDSFRSFLRASIAMSLAGLAAVFLIILYFAGRIVRPVAESHEKQKRFITDAGHEIKTPLAIIKANIDLMDMELEKKRIDRGELRENLGDINEQVDRLTGLTNDLVYLSRMEEAENMPVMTEVPYSDIVDETVEAFGPLSWEKGKAISADVEPMITVKGSSKELEKLLSILLDNALKYSIPPREIDCGEDEDGMPVPPEIDVILRREGKNAVLKVSNKTENELTNEQLSHVFERFYRTDSSRNSETGGHGIGLSMASAIVRAHGGKISAHTDTGHDFIVTASLPLA